MLAEMSASRLVAHLPCPPGPDVAALESALAEALAQARAAWPSLDVPEAEWIRWLGAKLAGAPASAEAVRTRRAADLWLTFACARDVPGALAAIERDYLTPLAHALSRREPPHEVEDALAQLRERLFVPGARGARIADYAGRGPLAAWLKIAALRTLANLRRARHPAPPSDAGLSDSLALATPELALLKAQDRAALATALRDAFTALTPDERNLLRLHFVEGLGLDKLARLYGLHRATCARRLAAARGRLRERALAHVRERLGLSGAALQSWVGLLRSQLGVSVRRLFEEPAAGAPPATR